MVKHHASLNANSTNRTAGKDWQRIWRQKGYRAIERLKTVSLANYKLKKLGWSLSSMDRMSIKFDRWAFESPRLHNPERSGETTNKSIMQKWFKCTVQYVKIDDEGRERKVSESYLIDAVTYTDAEARIISQLATMVRGEFAVKQITQTNIAEIFPNENGGWFYTGKISIVTIDEKAGKEKKITEQFLIEAQDFKHALKAFETGLSYILVPFEITSLAVSNIVDVFPYFEDDVNKQIPSNLKPIVREE